ncbi:MAG: GNAT family N-acetyltransferase [Desulfosporosinus sp.]|nr:GNAT family N-acetyltransferase [Desulfosporosinus sp.]
MTIYLYKNCGIKLKINIKNVNVKTLEDFNLQDITEMWNRCWLGYYYNMAYKQEHMKAWLALSQVSLSRSVAIFVDNRVVGFTLLSIDNKEGWIAGTCIDPDYRRNGLFTVLLRSQLNMAKSIFLKRIYLEVLEQNYARKIYQSVGFVDVRQLNVYRAQSIADFNDKVLQIHPVALISVDEYFQNRNHAFFNPAWQRRERYLRRHGNLLAYINQTKTAGALFAEEKSGLLLDLWSSNLAGTEEVLPTILQWSGASFSLTNQPNDWISTFLRAHGINPSSKQLEMCIELS